ncbi:hypothetical protein [Mucilaginibacter phyllosphaerae]|uniref:Uncharacterized protein n=1 Tax=Mucilaginibacter phyllosphaerae TaxID=1812349 RepID=A0A4Y8AE25_9SPHI|nr:hypothetical protein [Mucilaginibacter phyllosphaerae]MBB3970060.1 hypothetical protein [Mucilaginibacter phyllosphaerae]TEW66452.1 hypothetical protein E2R65_08470 [Mucilaginibacter phyllosphaerae]GGH09509.1 hypothetical protein GCM10007352_14930 [Mucilaginibacter phyllosphaerae]
MKTLTFTILIICFFALTSCSRYQLNVLSSTNTSKNEQSGNFEFQNDSVRISYSFYGTNAPVSINVYNKLEQPLYIDWQRSALIIGDKAISFVPENMHINGSIDATTSTYRNLIPAVNSTSFTTGNINAVAGLPKTTTFLPPRSQSNNTTLFLTNEFLPIPDSAFKNQQIPDKYTQSLTKVKNANFEKANSPLLFKTYLTLYTIQDNQPKPFAYQHEFFVSRSLTSLTDLQQLDGFDHTRGDYFILSKATGY